MRGKGLGTLKRFLGLAHHHVTAHAPIQTYANNHMIAELAEPRIIAIVPRFFPCVRDGVWEQDYSIQGTTCNCQYEGYGSKYWCAIGTPGSS